MTTKVVRTHGMVSLLFQVSMHVQVDVIMINESSHQAEVVGKADCCVQGHAEVGFIGKRGNRVTTKTKVSKGNKSPRSSNLVETIAS